MKNRKLLDYFLIFIGVASLIYFIVLIMNISFTNFLLIYPSITLILLAYASAELLTQQSLMAFMKPIIRYPLMLLITAGVISFIMVQCILVYNGTQKYQEKSDYTIVLGAQINGNKISQSLKNRLDGAFEIYQKYPDMIFIVSGGKGYDEKSSEAYYMNEYLLEKGIPDNQIILESRSTNTYQNLVYSKQLLDQFSNDAYDVTIVTNSFHTYRSKLIAENIGLEVHTYAAKAHKISEPNFYIREYFALLKDITSMIVNQ